MAAIINLFRRGNVPKKTVTTKTSKWTSFLCLKKTNTIDVTPMWADISLTKPPESIAEKEKERIANLFLTPIRTPDDSISRLPNAYGDTLSSKNICSEEENCYEWCPVCNGQSDKNVTLPSSHKNYAVNFINKNIIKSKIINIDKFLSKGQRDARKNR